MGQNIGTCVTAMLSSVGATKNAKRAAFVHLMFNIIGTLIGLVLFMAVQLLLAPAILGESATYLGISVCHTLFNILCTGLLLPSGNLLERLVCRLVPDAQQPEQVAELDERLLTTPSIALERCRSLTAEMAACAAQTLRDGVACLTEYTPELAEQVRALEEKTDHYEDILSTYLVKLSSLKISPDDSAEAAMLLKAIGDLERVGDHALNLLEAAEELTSNELRFSDAARSELAVLIAAVEEIVSMSFRAFQEKDLESACQVEPLEQVIDDLKEQLRVRHILRLQQGSCSIETGFIWSDLLNGLERVGDHCSNIAGCIVDLYHHDMNTHEALRSARIENENFAQQYTDYAKKYRLA
jgi:phosphate:Na+ symporter